MGLVMKGLGFKVWELGFRFQGRAFRVRFAVWAFRVRG